MDAPFGGSRGSRHPCSPRARRWAMPRSPCPASFERQGWSTVRMASRCRRFDNASDVVERTSARARASCVPLAPAWRTPLRRRRATRDVARNLRPPRSHARRARRPRVTLCRATLFPPSTFRGRTAFEREFRHSRTAPVACCDHVLFDLPETTTHAVDSPRARRRGGVRSRGRVAARCRVASLSAAAGDRRGYLAA